MINTDPKFDKENVIVAELGSWQYPDLKSIPGTYNENYNSFIPESGSDMNRISLRKAYSGLMSGFAWYGYVSD